MISRELAKEWTQYLGRRKQIVLVTLSRFRKCHLSNMATISFPLSCVKNYGIVCEVDCNGERGALQDLILGLHLSKRYIQQCNFPDE